ncbi:uncharacterized protein LOC120648459 isoform X2 [Panicum virgatum]|uniref:Uncharacterized protein n=1 Tax=Panicum virgatum TaxID=38727 RepID=A0A8T0N772_PANVG|nr:uncharacterized protein LOC120648459 isoform X2 [Panicum virgatum]KAG2544781.1 hypothetical protein PVAP13_9KG380071 [Panicum virgatum]KAG2544783.1 hypothetical protein PVAP13_9KG380071 [Panicum virgatum]
MGSLMSGWSSSVLSDKEVRLMRNRSLTNDEVEAFWRKHGGRPAENGEASPGGSPLAGSPGAETTIPLAARQLKAMRSMPPLRGGMRSDDLPSPCAAGQHARCLYPASEPSSPATTARGKGCFFHGNAAAAAAADDDDDTSSTSRGWWTRSSWAFLNDPPKEEVVLGRAQMMSFACDQFHAARIVTGNA